MSQTSKYLVCTVGLPRAGKTKWARSQGHPIVSPDAVRLAIHGQRFFPAAEPMVWGLVKTMVLALFGAGHEVVILDACNVSRKRRDEWQSGEWETRFMVIEETAVNCVGRALADGRPELVDVIARMADNFEPLGEDERAWP